MHAQTRPDFRAVVLIPQPGDDPADLEDQIHDQVLAGREAPGGPSAVKQVILDLAAVEQPQVWLKAAGPEVPDVNVRFAVGEKGYAVARALGLPAIMEIYPDVEAALRRGV